MTMKDFKFFTASKASIFILYVLLEFDKDFIIFNVPHNYNYFKFNPKTHTQKTRLSSQAHGRTLRSTIFASNGFS